MSFYENCKFEDLNKGVREYFYKNIIFILPDEVPQQEWEQGFGEEDIPQVVKLTYDQYQQIKQHWYRFEIFEDGTQDMEGHIILSDNPRSKIATENSPTWKDWDVVPEDKKPDVYRIKGMWAEVILPKPINQYPFLAIAIEQKLKVNWQATNKKAKLQKFLATLTPEQLAEYQALHE